jgi:hypothetical protein
MAVCVSGCLEVTDGVLEIKLDPAGGITCGDAGLAAASAASVPVTGVPVSLDACNGLTRHGDGLYAVCSSYTAGSFLNGADPATPVAIAGPNNTYAFTGPVWTITPAKCHDVVGPVHIYAGGLYIDDLVDDFLVQSHLEVNKNAGGFAVVIPDTNKRYINNGDGTAGDVDFNNMAYMDLLTIPAGGSATYQVRQIVTVQGAATGAGNLNGTLQFKILYNLGSSGC